MKHIRIKTDDDNLVHLEGVDDHTLCGLDAVGDASLFIGEPQETNRRVDCELCIQIIDHCKQVCERDIKRNV